MVSVAVAATPLVICTNGVPELDENEHTGAPATTGVTDRQERVI
jgi:hypothetical protein